MALHYLKGVQMLQVVQWCLVHHVNLSDKELHVQREKEAVQNGTSLGQYDVI